MQLFNCQDLPWWWNWDQTQTDRDASAGAVSLAFERFGEDINYQECNWEGTAKHQWCIEESKDSGRLRVIANLKHSV